MNASEGGHSGEGGCSTEVSDEETVGAGVATAAPERLRGGRDRERDATSWRRYWLRRLSDSGLGPALWMLAAALVFAVMGTFTHAAGKRCDWVVVAAVRALFTFSFTAVWAWTAGVRLSAFEPPMLWLRSLAGSVSLVCNFYAMTRLPVADAATLANTHPMWIVALSALALRRWPSLREAAGVVCGLVGVALVQQPHLDGDRSAVLAALIGAVATAVAMLGLHRLRGVDTRAIVAHFAGVASLTTACWLIANPSALTAAVLEPVTLSLLLGVGATGTLGQYCLTRAFAAGPPSRVAVIGLTQVVFAMGLDVALWGRALSAVTLAGFALVLAPTAWLMAQAGRRLREVDADAATAPERPDPEPLAPTPAS